ncbi:hypothetical protein FOXYSP1_01667 [Fusarium oxysporum f. sp. phaseoli]
MVDKGDIPDTPLLSPRMASAGVYRIESPGLLGSTWFVDLVLVQGTETLKRIFERCEIGWRQPSALDMLLRKSLNNSTALFLLFIA